MKFKYQARTKEGEMQVGFVDAGARDAALQILTGHGLFVLSVSEADTGHWYDGFLGFFKRVHRADLVIFARQLSTLLEAQLPLDGALKTLREQTTNETLREAIAQISNDIDSGLSFSQALDRQSSIFPAYYIEMVRAAEITGNMNEATAFLAEYTEREGNLASKATSAMIYPGVILGLFLVVGFILVAFVFPQITPIFEESNVAIPWYTMILLGAGTFLSKWWLAVIIVVGFVAVIVFDYLRSREGKALMDDVKVRFPVLKKVYIPLSMAKFGNAAALLIHGGIPIAQALEIIGKMMDNATYQEVIHTIADDVRQGQLLSVSIARYPEYFPPVVAQMAGIGETTGKTEEVFSRIAGIYTRETNQTLDNLVDLIQPILMIGMGLLVGFLFASILVPMYSLTASIQ
jgi:type IV pilus assembly protein PilC